MSACAGKQYPPIMQSAEEFSPHLASLRNISVSISGSRESEQSTADIRRIFEAFFEQSQLEQSDSPAVAATALSGSEVVSVEAPVQITLTGQELSDLYNIGGRSTAQSISTGYEYRAQVSLKSPDQHGYGETLVGRSSPPTLIEIPHQLQPAEATAWKYLLSETCAFAIKALKPRSPIPAATSRFPAVSDACLDDLLDTRLRSQVAMLVLRNSTARTQDRRRAARFVSPDDSLSAEMLSTRTEFSASGNVDLQIVAAILHRLQINGNQNDIQFLAQSLDENVALLSAPNLSLRLEAAMNIVVIQTRLSWHKSSEKQSLEARIDQQLSMLLQDTDPDMRLLVIKQTWGGIEESVLLEISRADPSDEVRLEAQRWFYQKRENRRINESKD
jgi:hypothetical protein